jgi:hypothetical protein
MAPVVLGVATAAADFFVHSGPFVPTALEAVVTGLGATLLTHFTRVALRRNGGVRPMFGGSVDATAEP